MGILGFIAKKAGSAALSGVKNLVKKSIDYEKEFEPQSDIVLLTEVFSLHRKDCMPFESLTFDEEMKKVAIENLLKRRGYENINGHWSKDEPNPTNSF